MLAKEDDKYIKSRLRSKIRFDPVPVEDNQLELSKSIYGESEWKNYESSMKNFGI